MTVRVSGTLLTIIASLLWGTTLVATGVGLQYVNPYNLVFLRFSAASAVIIMLSALFNRKLDVRTQLGRNGIWVLGAIYALGFLFQYVGQNYSNTSDATLLSNLAPTLVPIAAYAISREHISNSRVAATAVASVGLVLVAYPNFHFGSGTLLGDLLLFGSSVCYALFIVLSKRMSAGSVESAFAVVISVTLFLAPAAFLIGGLNLGDLKIGILGWFSIVYLAVPCSVIAISLYLKGLSSITASQSGALLLLELVVGLVLASLVLGEALSLAAAGGAALISLAIILSSRNDKDRH